LSQQLDGRIFDEILSVRSNLKTDTEKDKRFDFSMTRSGSDPGFGSPDPCRRLGEKDSVVFIRALCAVLPSLRKSTLSGLVKRGFEEMSGVGVEGCIGGTSTVRLSGDKYNEETRDRHLYFKEGLSSSATGGGGSDDLGGKGAGDKTLVRLVVRNVCVGYSCLDRRRKQAAAVLGGSDTGNGSAGAPSASMAFDQEGGGGGSTDRGEEEVRIFVQSAADVIVTLARSESEGLKTFKTEKYVCSALTEAIEEATRVLQSRGSTSSPSEVVFAQRICAAELVTAVVQGLLSAQGVSGGEPCVWYFCVSVFVCGVCVCGVCVCVCVVDVCLLCMLHISSPARVNYYGLYVLVDVENDLECSVVMTSLVQINDLHHDLCQMSRHAYYHFNPLLFSALLQLSSHSSIPP
jgi:hypothetical protein